MTAKNLIICFFIFYLLGVACTPSSHFITDGSYREAISRTFAEKKYLFADPSLFEIFDREMTMREREAMTFLYAYMPVGDITDYDGAFI